MRQGRESLVLYPWQSILLNNLDSLTISTCMILVWVSNIQLFFFFIFAQLVLTATLRKRGSVITLTLLRQMGWITSKYLLASEW